MKYRLRRLLAKCVSRLPTGIFTDTRFFEIYQRRGVHITPVNFYTPVPDTRDLENSGLWDGPSKLPGIDIRLASQIELLRECGRVWIPEYKELLAKRPASARANQV